MPLRRARAWLGTVALLLSKKETKCQRPSPESYASADFRTVEAFQIPPVGFSVHGHPSLSV